MEWLWDEGDGRGGQTGRFPLFFVSAQMPFNPPQLPFNPYFRPFAVKHLTSSLRCAILSRVCRKPSSPVYLSRCAKIPPEPEMARLSPILFRYVSPHCPLPTDHCPLFP